MRRPRRVQREKYSPVKLNNAQANILRSLVANLLDIPTPPELVEQGVPQYPSNRLVEMGDEQVTPEMLAEAEVVDEQGETVQGALRDQATVLRIIIALVGQNARPTPEAVEKRLFLELEAVKAENAREKAADLVSRVANYRSVPPDVEFLAGAYEGWYKRQRILVRLGDMTDMVRSPASDYDVTIALLDMLRDVTPDLGYMSETDFLSNLEDAVDAIREAYQRRQQGRSRGPVYPWQTLRDLCPIIQPGHMHVWSAPTKHGKTTFASEFGRYIALNQKEYMVVDYHLETDKLDLATRELAREFLIKPGDLIDGKVNIDETRFTTRLEEIREDLRERVGDGMYAKYKLIHCPDLSIQALEKDLVKQMMVAEAMGWEGVVAIVDYYQIMDWQASTGMRDEVAGRNELAIKLKNVFERLNRRGQVRLYGIVFAQDSISERGRNTPFGGTMIVQRGQVQFQIVGRDDVEKNWEALAVDKDGHAVPDGKGSYKQAKDGLGQPLFYHQAGDVDSERAIHVVRGNQVKAGYCFVQMMNGYFSIEELADRKPKWWDDYQAKQKTKRKRSGF